MATLSKFDNDRLQVVQHIPAFLDEIRYDFHLIIKHVIRHVDLSML
ncbi:MAG TPA: hypothetical protein VJ910_10985 [Desulfuromonadales bacterium]|nr:hypothetical protein [Desulfuromonadales bacterium]